MRVAHVSDCYLPRLGGIEMQVRDLATLQRERGHETTVVTQTPVASDGLDSWVDPDWVERISTRVGQKALRPIMAGFSVGDALEPGRFDVVHVHASLISPFAMLAARTAARSGIPTVVTVHSLWTRVGPVPDITWGMVGLRSWPAVWSAVSETASRRVSQTLGGAAVAILPNGIDAASWQTSPAPRPANLVTIASTMRLTRRKRPMPLLKMLRRVRDRVSPSIDLRAVIIGDGPLEKRMRDYLHAHHMQDWVEMPGRLDRSQIRLEFSQADLYVAPAELESFGIAALEARAAGLPVIASRHGGVGEFISDGDEGFLTGSDHEMVYAMTALAHDSRTRENIAAHNRSVLPAVTWPAVLDRTDVLYAAAIRRAARPVVRPISWRSRRRDSTSR